MHLLSAKSLLAMQPRQDISFPVESGHLLPEKVLQFGTGVLLRGLPDYLIDKANRRGIFNGRIVVVKSTDGGDMSAFARQDNLYTLCIRGVDNHQRVEQNVICSAISRVLSARYQWNAVLRVAASPELQVVISNTTEAGIQLVQDDIRQSPPVSFPGKLLAVLHARYEAFNGDPAKGLVIVPTELIPDNGTRLGDILLELAHLNGLDGAFIDWLETANTCCNSLVDRIVPGCPDPATQHALTEMLGYEDDLLTISESYRLWAIEGDERVQEVLSFHKADEGVIIRPNIDQYRELKLRLLNGTHTLSCGLAVLSGLNTVREAMEDEKLSSFMQCVMLGELIPGIPYLVDEKVAQRFGFQVLDRFRNPFIEHRWLAITMQYSAKMQLRNVPTLLHYYEKMGVTPRYMAIGLAAYLLFMRATHQQDDTWFGERAEGTYPIYDDQAGYFADLWARLTPTELTTTVLRNTLLWGYDLTQLPGFAEAVANHLTQLVDHGVQPTLSTYFATAEPVADIVVDIVIT